MIKQFTSTYVPSASSVPTPLVKNSQLIGVRKLRQAGFTIAELMVVIAIFALVTTVAMLNQGRLNSNVLLTNIAYETALAVRQAQVYGLGVKNTSNTTGSFLGKYGAHFDISASTNRQIIIYANSANSLTDAYDVSDNIGADEAKELYQFTNQRGNYIAYLCLGDPVGKVCDANASTRQDWLDVAFTRPNPAPDMYGKYGQVPPALLNANAYIVVTTLDGSNCRVVVVNPTGQIQVEGPEKGHCVTH